MLTQALKGGLIAACSQALTLLVGYGVLDNAQAAHWSAITMAVVNAAFLIAHPLHAAGLAAVSEPELPLPSDLQERGSVPPETLEAALPTAVTPDLGAGQ